MKYLLYLIFAAFSTHAWACDGEIKDSDCDMRTMEAFLPESLRTPVKNVRLEKFLYSAQQGSVAFKIDTDELTRLREKINKIAAQAFKQSQHNFQLLLQVALSPTAQPTFNMRIANIGKDEPSLRVFYDQASALTNFHSIKDTIYVWMQYKISNADK